MSESRYEVVVITADGSEATIANYPFSEEGKQAAVAAARDLDVHDWPRFYETRSVEVTTIWKAAMP